MLFLCDDNLGKLAKYLRILGFDTCFSESINDNELLRMAASQSRFLLTRDNHLAHYSHPFGILILENDDPLIQLETVIQKLGLKIDPSELFQRCSRCNILCRPADKLDIGNQVFPYILKTQDIISQCPSCERFYWKGSHYRRLLDKLRSAIPDNALTAPWPGN